MDEVSLVNGEVHVEALVEGLFREEVGYFAYYCFVQFLGRHYN